MSHEERIRQIQNGLEVVDLVKKIRAGPIEKPTYGRSAIGAPSTRERTTAWELFHQSTLDEARSDESRVEERDDNVEPRDDMGLSDDTLNAIGGGARTYKEAEWDDGEEPVLENKLVTNVQQDDPGRQAANSKSDHTYAGGQDNNAKRGEQSNGCSKVDKSNLSIIFEGSVLENADAKGNNSETSSKHKMNPNAKEYIPLNLNQVMTPIDQNTCGSADPPIQGSTLNEPASAKENDEVLKPVIKPRMSKVMGMEDLTGMEADVLSPVVARKQRTPIPDIHEIDQPPIPIKLSKPRLELLYEEDEDQESIPIEDVDKDKFGSQDTIFDLADISSDHDRRNVMAAKAIGKIISDAVHDNTTTEGVIYLSDNPNNPTGGQGFTDNKRKLKALEKTTAGKMAEDTPSRDVKKGIERNTVSPGMDQRSRSKSGAIPSVQESSQSQQKKSAPVTNVQSTVRTRAARGSSTSEEDSAIVVTSNVAESPQSCDSLSFDDYFDKLASHLSQHDLLKEVYRNQLSIMSKGADNGADSETLKVLINNQRATLAKLDALDRNVSKLGLAVSSMEQMLASMRIMIPGKPVDETEKVKNPTLRPVIGRETLRAEEVINIDPDKACIRGATATAKPSLFLEPLNSQKTNATQFIPENDSVSKKTLTAIVLNRIKDEALRSALLAGLEKANSQEMITKLHNHIKDAISANL